MNITDRSKRWWPAIAAFALVSAGTFAALPSDSKPADASDEVTVLVATARLDSGTSSATVKDNVEIRRVPADTRATGALSSLAEIPTGVLASTHVVGQQLLLTSFASNRATALGDGYATVSVKLDAQRWTGPVKVTGNFVSVYSILDGQPRLICTDAVVLDAPSPNDVEATDTSIISLGVKREFLAEIVGAADEEHLWLTGK